MSQLKKRVRKTRLDKEIQCNLNDGMSQWEAFKAAWHKLRSVKGTGDSQ